MEDLFHQVQVIISYAIGVVDWILVLLIGWTLANSLASAYALVSFLRAIKDLLLARKYHPDTATLIDCTGRFFLRMSIFGAIFANFLAGISSFLFPRMIWSLICLILSAILLISVTFIDNQNDADVIKALKDEDH